MIAHLFCEPFHVWGARGCVVAQATDEELLAAGMKLPSVQDPAQEKSTRTPPETPN